MFIIKYYRWAAGAISLALVIAGAVMAPSSANITWLAGLLTTYVLDLLPGLLH